MEVPETRYAKLGDDHIAYQVFGEGPIDIICRSGWVGHIEAMWDLPGYAKFLTRLASIGRVITFDLRGTGLSDPVPLTSLPTLDEWMDDLRSVLDAADSERASFVSATNSSPLALLFAATYPERVSGLVLINAYARFLRADDYPFGAPRHVLEDTLEYIRTEWGKGTIQAISPTYAATRDIHARWARYERQSAAPRAAVAQFRVSFEVDVRSALRAVRAPTLVLHSAGARFFRVGHGRYLAENIAGAKYVELPSDEESIFIGLDALLPEIEEFLTGSRPIPEPDRVLATVMFTDIVASTERAAGLGDQGCKELLARHNEIVRRELGDHRGREVNTAGDGFLATFDGPARAILCAQAIADRLRALDLAVRVGLHTGEVELMGDDVGGIAVHIAARVSAMALPGEVLVSGGVPSGVEK